LVRTASICSGLRRCLVSKPLNNPLLIAGVLGFKRGRPELFDRPLTSLSVPGVKWRTDDSVRVSVKTKGKPEIREVAVHYHQTNESRFLEIGRPADFARTDHISKAKWQSISMEGENNVYAATLRFEKGEGRYVALFVHVVDFAGKTQGYTSSLIQWVENSD